MCGDCRWNVQRYLEHNELHFLQYTNRKFRETRNVLLTYQSTQICSFAGFPCFSVWPQKQLTPVMALPYVSEGRGFAPVYPYSHPPSVFCRVLVSIYIGYRLYHFRHASQVASACVHHVVESTQSSPVFCINCAGGTSQSRQYAELKYVCTMCSAEFFQLYAFVTFVFFPHLKAITIDVTGSSMGLLSYGSHTALSK